MAENYSEHKCGGKCHGHKLRIKLATTRCLMGVLLALGIIVFLSAIPSRMMPWTQWPLFVAIAFLGLSVLMGSMIVEKCAHSLAVNNDWPVEAEVGGYAKWQKVLLAFAWILIIFSLVTSAYVRPSIRRPQPPMNPMTMQQQNPGIQPGDRMRQELMERRGIQPGESNRPNRPGEPNAQPNRPQPPQGAPGANPPQPAAPGGQQPGGR